MYYKTQIKDNSLKGYKEKTFWFKKRAENYAKENSGIVLYCNGDLANNYINFDLEFKQEEQDTNTINHVIGRQHIVSDYFKTSQEYKAIRTLVYFLGRYINFYTKDTAEDGFISVDQYGYRIHLIVSSKSVVDLRMFKEPIKDDIMLPPFKSNIYDVANRCFSWWKPEAIDLYNRCIKDNTFYLYK